MNRQRKQSPLTAYSKIKQGWGLLGMIACLVPVIIMPYYCVIGGWVVKYFIAFLTGDGGNAALKNTKETRLRNFLKHITSCLLCKFLRKIIRQDNAKSMTEFLRNLKPQIIYINWRR